MELHLVDPVAEAVVRPETRHLLVREPAPLQRLAAEERPERPQRLVGPARALSSGGGWFAVRETVVVMRRFSTFCEKLAAVALLEVDNVSRRFGGILALDELSLTVDEGEIAGLIGPNGAGKTTAFNVITRLYKPSGGAVRYEGNDLLKEPAHRIVRLGIARTFQNLQLCAHMTVLDNVLVGSHSSFGVGRERKARDQALEILDSLDLAKLAHSPAARQDATSLSHMLGVLHEKTAKWVSRLDHALDRRVWHNFRETLLTYEKSYLARLNYTHQNAVKHGLVSVASQYP